MIKLMTSAFTKTCWNLIYGLWTCYECICGGCITKHTKIGFLGIFLQFVMFFKNTVVTLNLIELDVFLPRLCLFFSSSLLMKEGRRKGE